MTSDSVKPQYIGNPEGWKLEHDFLKHLATLSSGSILLMVAFLEKLFKQPTWRFLICASLVSFTCSIVGSIFIQIMVILQFHGGFQKGEGDWPFRIFSVMAFGGFLLGIISLVVFALRNLY